ncbi:hypothetical protein [Bradyrhizobium genosp. P]|uniref:hypothetical protein n=1 Tax=Bradyrhizobium genosp. P TaxID=83641 RepID=UPI003CF0A30E
MAIAKTCEQENKAGQNRLRPPMRCSISKLRLLLANFGAILNMAAAVVLSTGDRLPVILISLLFHLTRLGAKRVCQTVSPRDKVSLAKPPSQAPASARPSISKARDKVLGAM